MSQKTTAEQKAEERYPVTLENDFNGPGSHYEVNDCWFKREDEAQDHAEVVREAFSTCYTEEVEPRDRMMQELLDALALFLVGASSVHRFNGASEEAIAELYENEYALITKAKEQFGITPTNTTE